MIARHLSVTRTARYYLSREPGPEIRELWIALHGHGQLARAFAKQCAVIEAPHRLVAVPEALNRYYIGDPAVQQTTQSVAKMGATWMTREDREAEIADYVGYLDVLHADLRNGLAAAGAAEDVALHVLGFSQGVSTALRWISLGSLGTHRPARAILWAGSVPPELTAEQLRAATAGVRTTLVAGTRDEFATAERVAAIEKILSDANVEFDTRRFDGGHRLDDAMLQELST